MFSQILSSYKPWSKKSYKNWQRFCKKKLDLKDMKFPVKIREIHTIEKRTLLPLVFLVMKTKKNIQSMYQKNSM